MTLVRVIFGSVLVLVGIVSFIPAAILINGGFRIGNNAVGIFDPSIGLVGGSRMIAINNKLAGLVIGAVGLGLCAGGSYLTRHRRRSIS
jgi:hypothetical protein